MSFREWISDLAFGMNAALGDGLEWLSERTDDVKAAVRRIVLHRGLPVWLNLAVAVAAAIAGWYSYLSAQRAAQIATGAQRFAERVNDQQLLMGRPVVTITGGALDVVKRGDELAQRLKLVVHNSGQRAALPAWVALFRGEELLRDASSWIDAYPQEVRLVEVPSYSEVNLVFNLPNHSSKSWAVAVAYGDDRTGTVGQGAATAELGLLKFCTIAKLLELTVSKPLSGEEGTSADISPGQPIYVSFQDTSKGGHTGPQAILAHLNGLVERDPRCSK